MLGSSHKSESERKACRCEGACDVSARHGGCLSGIIHIFTRDMIRAAVRVVGQRSALGDRTFCSTWAARSPVCDLGLSALCRGAYQGEIYEIYSRTYRASDSASCFSKLPARDGRARIKGPSVGLSKRAAIDFYCEGRTTDAKAFDRSAAQARESRVCWTYAP